MVKKSATTPASGLIALTILLVVSSIVCMVSDYRGNIPVVRNSVQTYLSIPLKSASSWPGDIRQTITDFFSDREKLHAENKALKRKIAWLEANLANQTTLEAEHRRLKSLFESTATHTRPVMIAEVLDSQIDANKHQIEINKGRRADVFEGQVVIDENGVVGQVTRLSDKSALVSLITDERQRIPVFIERNRLRMIARGSGDLTQLEMEFVNKNADVRVGDKIVTSGLGDRYPRGYGIGVVTAIESSPANEFMQVHAKPLAALDKVLEVLLIQPVGAPQLDILSSEDDEQAFTDPSDAQTPDASVAPTAETATATVDDTTTATDELIEASQAPKMQAGQMGQPPVPAEAPRNYARPTGQANDTK